MNDYKNENRLKKLEEMMMVLTKSVIDLHRTETLWTWEIQNRKNIEFLKKELFELETPKVELRSIA